MKPESTRIRRQKRAKPRTKNFGKKSLRTLRGTLNLTQQPRGPRTRARREPDSPMPQACPEDAPVISSSKSKIFKFFFFPAERQHASWETRARRCPERSSGSALGGNAGTSGTHVTSTSSPSFWHPWDLHPTSGSPEQASGRPHLYGGAYRRPTVWGRKKVRSTNSQSRVATLVGLTLDEN